MKNRNNTQKLMFEEFYKTLNNKEKARIRNEFLISSGLSYPAFYSKLRKGGFFNLEIKELSRICKKDFMMPGS